MVEMRQLHSFADLAPCDAELDQRAAALRPKASAILRQFPPEAVADMLAYAAARLERTGFQMFQP